MPQDFHEHIYADSPKKDPLVCFPIWFKVEQEWPDRCKSFTPIKEWIGGRFNKWIHVRFGNGSLRLEKHSTQDRPSLPFPERATISFCMAYSWKWTKGYENICVEIGHVSTCWIGSSLKLPFFPINTSNSHLQLLDKNERTTTLAISHKACIALGIESHWRGIVWRINQRKRFIYLAPLVFLKFRWPI